jgi:hypothetical protein
MKAGCAYSWGFVNDILRYVAGCAAGTRLAFTYVHRAAVDGSATLPDAAGIIRNVAMLGEPRTFGFVPE